MRWLTGPARLTRSAVFLMICGTGILTSAGAFAAGRFYYEMGAGAAQIRAGSVLFSSAASDALGFGIALNLAVAAKLTSLDSPLQAHFGLQHRFSTGSDNASAYSLQASYPFLRLEASRIFVTLGATPLVWTREATLPGFSGFKKAGGMLLVLTELGYLWPITPAVSMALVTALENPVQGGTFSFKPVMHAGAQLRFFFGEGGSGGGSRPSLEDSSDGNYGGWRYPYGNFR